MRIDEEKLYTLWYENSKGDKYVSDNFEDFSTPEGFNYQVSEFPTQITRTYLKIVQREEVNACDHPSEFVKPTYGWIEGIEGRECKKCYGTQMKDEDVPWPDEWEAHGSRRIATGNSSWPADLVLAMTRPLLNERITSLMRGYGWNKTYEMRAAILIAANGCERCMNSLAHRYGLGWGYREHSEEWGMAGTTCDFCH